MSVGADHETCAEGAARALSFASFGDQRRDVRRGVGEKLRLSSLDDLDGVGSWIRHGLAQAGGIRGCARPRSRCLGASRSALSLRVRMIGPPPERLPMSLSGASPCLAASLEAAEIAGVLLPAIASAADEEDDPAHPTAGFPGRLEVSAQRLASVTWSIFWTAKTTSKMVCRLEHVTGGLEFDTPGPALSPRCLRHCEARREKRDLMAEPRRIRDAVNTRRPIPCRCAVYITKGYVNWGSAMRGAEAISSMHLEVTRWPPVNGVADPPRFGHQVAFFAPGLTVA